MSAGALVAEPTYYLPTCLVDDRGPDASGEITLIAHRYRVTQGPSGRRHLKIETEAPSFPDGEALAGWIESRGAHELPPEAEGRPGFVPDEVRALLEAA